MAETNELKRIANALERIVAQNDESLQINRAGMDHRVESDQSLLAYWEANEKRDIARENRKDADAFIKSISDSVERAKAVAAAKEILRLMDDNGDPIGTNS